METLKQVTSYDNIKYEMTHEQIQPISTDTKNTSLILAQNKELIEYTNKLKLQLAKSYAAIMQSENMQKENVNLKKEIIKLRVENHRLKNYIAKTFEVVKNLFSFPIDRFKRIVDNFIHSKEK